MRINTVVLYGLSITALLIAIFYSPESAKLSELSLKSAKVEFFQEATRIMNNLIGFDQIYQSLPNNTEKSKQCKENQDLLKEWSDDVSALQNLNKSYVDSDENAKTFLKQTQTLFDQIKGNCAKLAS